MIWRMGETMRWLIMAAFAELAGFAAPAHAEFGLCSGSDYLTGFDARITASD